VIELAATGEGLVVAGGLSSGWVAYVDAGWLPSNGAGPVAAVVVSPEGELHWYQAPPVSVQDAPDTDTAAAAALLSLASEAAAVLGDCRRDSVDVTGGGVVAAAVRMLLGDSARRDTGTARAQDPPAAVVDTTGDPEVIVDATQRLAPLGTLVLAGEPNGREVSIDLYPNVHVRGLQLVGVTASGADRLSGDALDRLGSDLFQTGLARVSPGGTITRGALWYRLAG
jgi:hypothetical protein